MKKDITRDYTIDAFRLYAVLGQPTYNQAVKDIRNRAIQSCKSTDPQDIITYANEQVNKNSAMLADISAVYETLKLLRRDNKEHIISAIEGVYFVTPRNVLRKNDITSRVRNAALEIPASETSVYKWLREARQLFSAIRGLRNDGYSKYIN